MITIGIVDDEENARRVVLKYLERYCDDFDVLFEATQFQETIDLTIENQPDLLFLDINLLDGSGIDVAQELKDKTKTIIVFTTAYNEYAIQALKLKAFDYLLKPIDVEEFQEMIQNVVAEIKNQKIKLAEEAPSKISISTLNGTQLIDKNSITLIKAEGSYCEICLNNGKSITVSKPLKYMEQQIENHPKFLKIHKSYIINSDYVDSLDRVNNEVVLMNFIKLPISRSNIKTVFSIFQNK